GLTNLPKIGCAHQGLAFRRSLNQASALTESSRLIRPSPSGRSPCSAAMHACRSFNSCCSRWQPARGVAAEVVITDYSRTQVGHSQTHERPLSIDYSSPLTYARPE